MQVVNPDIEPNCMLVEFKCITNSSKSSYYIKWGLDANGKWQQFQSQKVY